MTVVATTERLRLVTWNDARKTEFARVTNTPAVMRWLGGVASDQRLAEAFGRLDGYQRDHGFTFWAVERLDDGALLGFCGLKRTQSPGGEHLHGAMEIGWRLREDAWGQGYAGEAARKSLELAFERFGAPFVIALTVPGNVASQKLMKRLGMKRMRHLEYKDRRYDEGGPDWNPEVVTLITTREWRAAQR